MHRTRFALFTAATLTTAALTAAAGQASASATHQEPIDYVALGDSYTAGPLIPFQRLDPLGCFRSTSNYPAWLADHLDVRSYTDVSCSSADTTDMTGSQPLPVFGAQPPQFSALDSGTDLVTIGIGGNDFGVFGELISVCPELAESDPTGSPCQDTYTVDGIDTMKQRIEGTQDRVVEVLRGVHERSPEATVVLVGYPRIAPETGYCPDILPFADGDLRWLDSVEQTLNTALDTAANVDGDTVFVDTYTPSAGHDACATGGAAWIQGKDTDLFRAASYHPLRSGMVGVASIIANTLAGQSADAAPAERALRTADSRRPHSTMGEPVATPGLTPEYLGKIPGTVAG